MSIFKCKMCGGTLEINNNETVASCEYCGTQQTLPKLDDEKKANMYDRANHFRRNNEFDKAMGIYEQILNEDNTDAEAYWSLVLCRYGIEYVEDPSSHKRVPTVNRAQYTSVFNDDNYKSALNYADSYQKAIYEEEAKAINEIQKGILEISQKEEPFDVFICYKETDNNGRRTPDSVLAQDLYYQLKQEGFKVFFSRITLEDKLGSAYEPYIFAALNSSKVMVVLGTKPEFFNAVWVKNEWSRYLALIKNGAKKMLIPAYKDMDPYDLPEEFSHLQAQDMSKLGFMQDLIRGIKKIAQTDTSSGVKETVVVQSADSGNASALVKRGFLALEDGEWEKADEFFEQALNQNAEDAQAYLGKLMIECHAKNQEDLQNCQMPFDDSTNYKKIIRFGDKNLSRTLEGYIAFILERNENQRLEDAYELALRTMNTATSQKTYLQAATLFEEIVQYKNSQILAENCTKSSIYIQATNLMESNEISSVEKAIKKFGFIPGWKDSEQKIDECYKKIEEIKVANEEKRIENERQAEQARIERERYKQEAERIAKRNKKIAVIATPIVCVIIAFIIVLNTVIIPNGKYNEAIALMDARKYTEAISAFEALDGYKDSIDKIEECNINIYGEAVWNKIKNVNVGDTCKFGSYEQDNNKSNGLEDIEWLVLSKEGTRFLVISKYALDYKEYNTSYTDVTWETCTLRKWLNNDFINSAFSTDEKAMIPTVTVSADKNHKYDTNPGNATQDQVFLLSITEANKYFNSDRVRRCEPTDYTVAKGAWESDFGSCRWLLRSPGHTQIVAAYVFTGGDVNEYGSIDESDKCPVRPAMWIGPSEIE